MLNKLLSKLIHRRVPRMPIALADALLNHEMKAPQPDDPFSDLPRMPGADGKGDDTERMIAHVKRLYYPVWNCPDQTHNQRGLYMAIYYFRTSSLRRWNRDNSVSKLAVPIGQLEAA